MREILPTAAAWVSARRPFAIATVVAVAGSAPREVGASMIVADDGELRGNVSGGCVEAAVHAACLIAIDSGRPSRERFGYADAEGIEVGLTCGGEVEVLVRPVLPGAPAATDIAVLADRDARGVPTTYTVWVAGERLGEALIDASEAAGSSITMQLGRPPRLVVVGAVEFAVPLSRLGAAMGMRVEVVDPREAFATPGRFGDARVIVDWPDRHLEAEPPDDLTAVCVLSHDPRFDVPALRVALASAAAYVGALGSRRTHAERLVRLQQDGVPQRDLARLRSPIGLDLGGRTPEETALSILSEIVADRHSATGMRLSARSGPVHGTPHDPMRDAVPSAHVDDPKLPSTTRPGAGAGAGAGAVSCAWDERSIASS